MKSSKSASTADNSLTLNRRKVENHKRKIEDYQLVRIIGTGTFGKVYLSILNGKSFALKMLSKRKIIELKQIDHIKNEKNILAGIQHPFVVNLVEAFQDDINIYLVFDFVQGGEIFRLLRKENNFPNDVALFYIAEITLSLQFLHEKKIAYRDLKPENLLIGSDGHLKITDFGFAKRIVDKSYTLCGTPEYLAPEIIMGQGHNEGVDWWALGILLYEMLSGYPPFYDANPYDIYRRIAIGYYEFPSCISMQARQLISGLLEQDLSKRLGCLNGGAEDVMNNAWFQGVDWGIVLQKRIQPPWLPELTSD